MVLILTSLLVTTALTMQFYIFRHPATLHQCVKIVKIKTISLTFHVKKVLKALQEKNILL